MINHAPGRGKPTSSARWFSALNEGKDMSDYLEAAARQWQKYWDRLAGVDRAVVLDIERTGEA